MDRRRVEKPAVPSEQDVLRRGRTEERSVELCPSGDALEPEGKPAIHIVRRFREKIGIEVPVRGDHRRSRQYLIRRGVRPACQ